MKTLKLNAILILAALISSSQAAIWYSGGNNNTIDVAANWGDTAGGGGVNPATAMNVDNDDTWIIQDGHRMSRGGSNDFFGTLQVDNTFGNDSEFLNRGGSNFEAIILNGGALNNFRSSSDGITATTVTVTANGGILGGERDASLFAFGTLSGSGDILVQGRSNGSPSTSPNSNTTIRMQAGADYSGYTGTFIVQEASTNSPFFGFEQDVPVASFGLQIQDGGSFNLANDISVTTLRIGPDFVPVGTYSFGDFTAAQQSYLTDNGGSLVVTEAGVISPPEIENGPVVFFDETSASPAAEVFDTGGESPTVTLYYGTSNGGIDPNPATGWEFSADFDIQSGKFSGEITGLTDATTYFYRFFASNSAGGDWANSSGTFTTGAPVPTIYYSTGNNRGLNNISTWNDEPNGTGNEPFFMPTAPGTDSNIWVVQNGHRLTSDGGTAFYGGTLRLGNTSGANDSEFLNSSPNDSFTLESVVLDGGAFNNFREPFPIIANEVTVTASGGILGAEDDDSLYRFGRLVGEGNIFVQGRGNGATVNDRGDSTFVRMEAGTDYSGFTGTFIVQDVTGNSNGFFGFEGDVVTGTFGLEVQDGSSFSLQNSVTVATLTLGAESISEGTYTFADFSSAQQAYLVDNGGTLIIGGGVSTSLEITDITVLPDDMISLTWNSKPDTFYTILYSTSLTTIEIEVGGDFESQGTTTTHAFENPTLSGNPSSVAPTLFFQISENN